MELRIDPNVTTAGTVATIEDVYDLHNAAPDGAAGEGVTVAVMDTGTDPTHPVFDGVDVSHRDFTGSGEGDAIGHGTGVSGLIAQLAPGADIVSLRVFGDSGRTGMRPIAEAYEWVIDHADDIDVCNFSWGARSSVEAIDELHREVVAAGVQDVVSAGNTGSRGGSPATTRGAFSVGALTEEGELTRFSSYDPNRDNPDVAALGKDLELARAEGTSIGRAIDDEWVKASGTSFSASIATGLVARYLAAFASGVVRAFESSARDVPGTPEEGEGIVDYGRALESKKTTITADALAWDFLDSDVVHLNADWFESGRYTAVRVDDETIRLVPDEGP